MASYPAHYRYTKEHEWIATDGGQGTVGITDYAQQQLGDVVYVEMPKTGAPVKSAQAFGSVESVKAVSEIFSPVSGTVEAVNPDLTGSPELINQDPHGRGWLVKVSLANPEELEHLMTADQYQQFIATQEHA
ncbi:MAG: glycine cleavage system protein GcvH [Terriglobales bacterium]